MKKLLQDVFSNNLYHFEDYSWTRARRKPGSVSDNHLSRHTVAGMLQRPTFRAAAGNCPAKAVRPFWSCSGWGLHETYVTIHPRELLPHDFTLTANAAVCFCCTFPIVTYAGRYPAPLPCGARTFLMTRCNECKDVTRLSGLPKNLFSYQLFLFSVRACRCFSVCVSITSYEDLFSFFLFVQSPYILIYLDRTRKGHGYG